MLEKGLPQHLAVPLDPISVGAYERRHALPSPSAVGRHALGSQRLDPRSGRFDAPGQEFGQSDALSLGEPVAVAQEAQTARPVGL